MIDEILKVVNKFIPDANLRNDCKIELERLEIEKMREKGKYLDKINKCIPFVLPCFLLALLFMFVLVFMSDFIFSIIGQEAPLVHIDDRLIDFCKWFVAFLFGKKTIEKFGKK